MVRTRAVVSFAWVAGPPVATAIIAAFGPRAILAAIAAVAVLNLTTTAAMRAAHPAATDPDPATTAEPVSRGRVGVLVGVFIALQATNVATTSIMTLFVTDRTGAAYYTAMPLAHGPALLLAFQVLNAWFFAAVAGVGLTMFQELIPRPGLASGLYTNTRRLGAIAAGPLVAVGSATSLGYGAVFLLCAVISAVALAGLRWMPSCPRRPQYRATS